jgi:tetratricopeptide (TPR) repeat protein
LKIPKETKQKIIADKNQLSIHQISKKYNLPKNAIKNIIEASEKKYWFYAVLILIPVIFFIILELLLRQFNYGYDTNQWTDLGGGKYVINPDVGKRYFNNLQNVPFTNEDVFDQDKRKNAYRIFVLGASSAAGFPYMPLGSFSNYIKRRLEITYPNTTIEVVNLSITGVNSYTLLDLVPGILEQKPDLILIYAGHNEFYGALGIGSAEFISTSRSLVRLVLYLNKYKTTQFVRNSINWVNSVFESEDSEKPSGTLMSRMARDQYIPLNSDKFNAGLEQFSENLKEILKLTKDNNVPVIVSKLASNLKDQKPFVFISDSEINADQVYEEAVIELKNNNITKADSLFRLSKDLDALRFRAPEEINKIIGILCKEFGAGTVPIDSLFNAMSPDGIVGNNLMVDHLHPNPEGYKLIGKAFYEIMQENGNIPGTEDAAVAFNLQDSVTRVDYMFTDLDSVIGNYSIILLKNAWPFVKRRDSQISKNIFIQSNFIDSIALEVIEKKISWSDAHLNASIQYLKRDDIKNHIKHMNILVYQYPFLKDYNTALRYFYERNKLNPGDFTLKKMGIISLYNKNYDDAIRYLTQSNQSDSSDIQVLYNLALAYKGKQDFKSALVTINKCLNIDPDHAEAIRLKNQLKNMMQ